MHIKDVTIEGFKSYAKRVHIPNFDPRFNAITGLNGTGKSNILDAICFVLGITNLSQVRAGSLLDLVYKKGQAGVTEAVVCLTFDNGDKSRSPAGYEDKDTITVTRQIVVGGRNKYRLNGRQATPTQIHEFFRGVQLNVNNPHFLIMQGRITQVLNMKPAEILSMLEEVAGTRMYEEKRGRAFQTFEKKTQKLKEFDEVMAADLRPTLHRLKEERNKLLQFNKAKESLAALEQFCIAYDFSSSQRKQSATLAHIEESQQRQEQLETEVQEIEERIKAGLREMKQLEERIDQQHGSCMHQLQTEAEALAKALSQEEASLQTKLQERHNILEELQNLEQSLAKFSEDVMAANFQKTQETFDAARSHEAELATELSDLDKEIAQFTSGDGASSTFLSEKLESCKIQQLNLRTRVSEMELKSKTLEEKQAELRKQAFEGPAIQSHEQLQRSQQAIQEITHHIQELRFDENGFREMEAAMSQKQSTLQAAKDRLRQISRTVGDLGASIEDPYRGFDRSSVKGIVGSLFKIKQPDVVTALEVAGGGRLKNLVVDTADTAQAILSHGRLRRKITILPLDKIRPDEMPASVKSKAAELFGNQAAPATDFIDFSPELRTVMQFVFGRVFVCKDNETAKQMAYHPSIRTRCVTLDGNDYSPSGLLTSGHRAARGALLQPLHELNQAQREMQQLKRDYEALQAQVATQKELQNKYTELMRELEVQQHAAHSAQERIQEREQRLNQTGKELEQELIKARQCHSDSQRKLSQLHEQQRELEHMLQNFDGNEGSYLAQIQTKSQNLKAQHSQAQSDLKSAEQALQRATAMQTDVAEERSKVQQQLNKTQEALRKLEETIRMREMSLKQARERSQAAAAHLEQHRARTRHFDGALKQMALEKQSHEERLKQHNTERRHLSNKEGRLKLESAQLESHLKKLQKDHPWILEQQRSFGVRRSPFDWTAQDPNKAMKQYQHAKATIKSMGKTVDASVNQSILVISQFESTQNEYRQLHAKHKRVLKDRKNIEEAISDLDSKKSESIRVIWEKVNREFGSIFGTLLPGASAKLEPPECTTYLEGLEVKVSLGGVWKHSLSELSGGQRSLLALSLILSILLFKPAPFYILDEVDSALDLNHTQNIGQMIQRFFPQSQFIIVSLKEGMFSNANVLFKTKFSEGVSSVSRLVPDQPH